MKLDTLMKKAIHEKREMIIHDGYNNLYRLVPIEDDCFMYEHYNDLKTKIQIDLTYEMICNDLYEELINKNDI